MKATPPPGQTVRKRSVSRTLTRIAMWLFGVPVSLALVLYVALLIHPIPLPFLNTQIRNIVVASMPPGTELELGDMALALENYTWPVIRFTPVVYKDTSTGAKVAMDAFEVGFSPIRALVGQPGATVTIVGPHIQVNQDLFGPRLADLEVVPDPKGGPATVRVIEGSTAFPDAGIRPEGIDVNGMVDDSTRMRSDNDWLVYNLEAAQEGIASIIQQAQMGRFSRLVVKDATMEMNDALYGYFRHFSDVNLDIAPTPNNKAVEGKFSANFGGTVMQGTIERVLESNGARLRMSLTNFDLASFAPNINDPQSIGGIVGPAAVSLDIGFDPVTGKATDGDFHIDLTGTEMRLADGLYPIATGIMEIHWAPETGTFTLDEAPIRVGDMSLKVAGVFVLGLDDLYGPTVGISMTGHEVSVPSASGERQTLFDNIAFKGWSAPLYGAIGIDQAVLSNNAGARIESKGRLDMLKKGVGVDLAVAAEKLTIDDLKNMWPPDSAPEARDWFVKNVLAGTIDSANMKFAFPVGTLALNGPPKSIPQNGVFAEIVASGVKVKPTDQLAPIEFQGKTRVQMHDSEITVAADGGVIPTDKGNISVANAAVVMTSDTPDEQIVEVSGDLSGGIPALTAILGQVQPDAVKSADLPVDINALAGDLTVRTVATVTLDANNAVKSIDYSANGHVVDFGSTAPMEGHTIGHGQLSFMATPAGYKVGGTAQVDGMAADLLIQGDLKEGSQPSMTLSSEVDVADMAKMGFDASEFASGKIGFVANPMPDGSISMAVDLKQAKLDIKDLGIAKPAGEPGMLKATIKQTGDVSDISEVNLAFGDVKLQGSLQFDAKKGLQSAEFSNFALSPGDAAQLSLTPIKDGFQVRIRGDQFDMKPMLKRFFSLDQGSAGPQATSFTQTIAVDAQLGRALGFYKTNAYNVNLDMALKGTDLKKVSLQAQLGDNSSVSIVTNPTPDGHTLTVVFNDLGSLLRLAGVYAQVEGGAGSLVLQQNTSTKVDTGQFNLKNFAIVDEKNVADILDSHPDSRQLIARQNKLSFRSGTVDFVHRVDRVQINNAVLTGDSVGGTAQGFIYTDSKQYDLVGTYIPMFGINNAFGKLFGPLGGGKNGGLFGITFAIKGPLDNPTFKINPMSALAPGAFRSLFEYRAKEEPRVDGDGRK